MLTTLQISYKCLRQVQLSLIDRFLFIKTTFRLGTSAIAYLTDIAFLFQAETDNYTPLLLTIEVIFTELLKRGDLIQEIVPLKPIGKFYFPFPPFLVIIL